jgi:hypothetical protein
MQIEIQNELNRLRNLKQYKDKPEQDLIKQAQINIARKRFAIEDRLTDKNETLHAQDLFDQYVGYYGFEKLTDLETLGDLIYELVLLKRVQNHLNKLQEENKDTYIRKSDLECLHEIEQRILDLKVKLGIDNADTKKDELSALQLLAKRFHSHIQQNKNEFTIACASCGTMLLLRKKVKDFSCLVHPWFAGRFYFNYEILKDVKDNKLNKEQASRYLKTSTDYIDWCLKNWDTIIERYNANTPKAE